MGCSSSDTNFDYLVTKERKVKELQTALDAEKRKTKELKDIITKREQELAGKIEEIRKEADRIISDKMQADQRDHATKVAQFESTISYMTELMSKVSQIKLPDIQSPLVDSYEKKISDFYQQIGINITNRRVMRMTEENIEKSARMREDIENRLKVIQEIASCINEAADEF